MTKEVVIPTSPADQATILAAIKEADDSLNRIASEKEQVKAIVEDLAEKFEGLNKKYIRKLITTYHKQNFDKMTAESEDFVELYEAIVK